MGEVNSNTRKATKGLTTAQINGRLTVGKYHDGGGLGLFLRVDPDGSKFWIQRITLNGKRPELGLGSYPAVSLAQAREAAWKNKQTIRDGLCCIKSLMSEVPLSPDGFIPRFL